MTPGGYGDWSTDVTDRRGMGIFDRLVTVGETALMRAIDVETYSRTGGNMAPGGTAINPASVTRPGLTAGQPGAIPSWAIFAGLAVVAVLALR